MNIVLPLSSVWQDKADKRWSHVSTSHNRKNRARALWKRRESNAGISTKKAVLVSQAAAGKTLSDVYVFIFLWNKRNCMLANASLRDRRPCSSVENVFISSNVILTYVNMQQPTTG